MKKCRHPEINIVAYSSLSGTGECSICGEKFQYDWDAREKPVINKRIKASLSSGCHKLYHEFERKFKVYDSPRSRWKYQRYELMERVEKWAAKHPDVVVTSVDDDHFAGSFLVFIPHIDKKKYAYMGSTVVFIPQNGGPPSEMFLYPKHVAELLVALGKLVRLHVQYGG